MTKKTASGVLRPRHGIRVRLHLKAGAGIEFENQGTNPNFKCSDCNDPKIMYDSAEADQAWRNFCRNNCS